MNLSTSSDGIVITSFTFSNICIDAVNLSNILHPTDMTYHVPEYFYHQTVLIVSDYYTKKTTPRRFRYNKALQEINVQEYLQNSIVFCVFCFVLFVLVRVVWAQCFQCLRIWLFILESPSVFSKDIYFPILHSHNSKIMMGSVEEYKRTWFTREHVELEALSVYVKSIRFLILRLLHKLNFWLNIQPKSVFNDKKANRYVSSLRDKYVIVPADKEFNKQNYL